MTASDFGEPVDPRFDPDIESPERRPPTEFPPKAPPLPQQAKEDPLTDGPIVVEKPEEKPEEEEFSFEPEDLEQFKTLLSVGFMTKHADIFDTDIYYRTLNTDDELLIGLFTKPFIGTDGYNRAYQLGVSACGVLEMDNEPLVTFAKEKPSRQEIFNKKVEKLRQYRPVVINEIYNRITDLEVYFYKLAKHLGKLPG